VSRFREVVVMAIVVALSGLALVEIVTQVPGFAPLLKKYEFPRK
jgi:hypothetical protein